MLNLVVIVSSCVLSVLGVLGLNFAPREDAQQPLGVFVCGIHAAELSQTGAVHGWIYNWVSRPVK